jgi:BirA family biotin operon repressor/biotin-[acetyl-CoA-carboxylase] ligase
MAAGTDSTPLTVQAVTPLLRSATYGRTLHILPITASTNGEAMALAQRGAAEGTAVLAEEQTAGKGRLGRRWHSPPGENLYCSIIMRHQAGGNDISSWLSWVPLQSALAVARAVRTVAALTPELKWPNDIVLGSRKLGGLLCESGPAGPSGTCVVVGIGLNVNSRPESFPADIRETATSMAAEAGRPIDRAILFAAIMAEMELSAEALRSQPAEALMESYSRLCSTLGRRVKVLLAADHSLEGLAESIGPDGSLRVVPSDPSKRVTDVRSGDVVHLR